MLSLLYYSRYMPNVRVCMFFIKSLHFINTNKYFLLLLFNYNTYFIQGRTCGGF